MVILTLPLRTHVVLLLVGMSMLLVLIASFMLQLVAYYFGRDHIFGLLPLFNVDREGNLAAWLSATTMLFLSMIAYSLGSQSRSPGSAWKWVALVFFLMALDEGAQIHERVGDVIQPLVPSIDLFYFEWTAVALIGLAAGLPLLLRILWRIRTITRWRLVCGMTVFLVGALGIEMITGLYMGGEERKMSLGYFILSHLEEGLELAGLWVLLYAVLSEARVTFELSGNAS